MRRTLRALCVALVCTGCARDRAVGEHASAADVPAPKGPSAWDVALAPQPGESPLDLRIRAQKARVRTSIVPVADLERLGLMFIGRARELSDPGGYTLALSTAEAMRELAPAGAAALALRGMALHGLHRFVEAEGVARALVAQRGLPMDLGLLGDVLVDRGELDEAISAYQRMVDLRPDLHAYARAAHVRYLKGDLLGAADAMTMAAKAASPRNRETFAWAFAKLASYRLALGELAETRDAVHRALGVFPESLPALKAHAQLLLFEGAFGAALSPLRKAVAQTPHPELLWMLSDTLDALGRDDEADAVRRTLRATGAQEDPRSYALYLATRGEALVQATALVQTELRQRRDIYTYEALAWVQSARGEHTAALASARRALAEGTPDARLYYHAGTIARRAAQHGEASTWLNEARAHEGMLLPSQRARLRESFAVR